MFIFTIIICLFLASLFMCSLVVLRGFFFLSLSLFFFWLLLFFAADFDSWNLIAFQLNITAVCLKTKTTEREVGRRSKPKEDLSGR